ncbi:MAG: outer membrane lipoprotein-sorting protein, partial [Gemmatimonadaceae bacterium]
MIRVRRATAAALLALAATAPRAAAQKISPDSVVDRVDRLLRGTSSRGSMSMHIVTRQWTRTLDMDIWSLGNDYALVRVTAPV